MKKAITICLCCMVFCGCFFGHGLKQREAYVAAHPELTQLEREDIIWGKIRIGMSREHLIASWGRPNRINETVGAWGKREQFVYGSYGRYSKPTYVYVENGEVTSWQK